MVDLTGCVSIPYFKKTVFTGSYGKMRYLIGKTEEQGETVLKAWYWEGPYASSNVAEESKDFCSISFLRRWNQPGSRLAE
mgnify:CR=1 FL=1